ncbi:amino acid adenylation domain-containing protein [Photorhabdus noenieputensis]|uniref:non-ribosomal peptide synthetase n=1 Tax=Photorhabdus noenieputensis TaxID=1208607 RepID=UPI001BD4C952|nr:non-ribosomal peptide synthetase [Photorhabdus noenieputensis]MBS9439589.1 amino acid adenylation domain-containing protein [Photorhabdus noenieputensis]MCK3668871.1 amino acid adenylation domain-containing protein [Photorhabdus noenieputensis]
MAVKLSKGFPILSEQQKELFDLLLKKKGIQLAEKEKIQPTTQSEIPLSLAQERIWFLHQLEPNSAFYNTPFVIKLKGQLDYSALEMAVQTVIDRHEILRTIFPTENNMPLQKIMPSLSIKLPIIDLSNYDDIGDREAKAHEITDESVQDIFNLEKGPLVKTKLIKLSNVEHWFIFLTHHMVFDGWSVPVLGRELTIAYNAYLEGVKPNLDVLSIQYKDFSVWQRERLTTKEHSEKLLNYWKKELNNFIPNLTIDGDYSRPSIQRYNGASIFFDISQEKVKILDKICQENHVTLFVGLLTVFKLLVYIYTEETDITISTGIANRNRAEIEPLIGCFINILLLRSDLSNNPTFIELIRRIGNKTSEAFSHQDLPFELLVSELQPKRDSSFSPLVQMMIVFHNADLEVDTMNNLFSEMISPEKNIAQYDLLLHLIKSDNGVKAVLEYNTDLYKKETARSITQRFNILLEKIITNPAININRLNLLNQGDEYFLAKVNNTTIPIENIQLHELFERQVANNPQAVAVYDGEQVITYSELSHKVNLTVQALYQFGVKPGAIVAICVDPSTELIQYMLAILKIGAAYLPLDSSYPEERLQYMLDNAEVATIVTQKKYVKNINTEENNRQLLIVEEVNNNSLPTDSKLSYHADPESLAYVIYTSGSTGRPKGIAIKHRGIVNNLLDLNLNFSLKPSDRLILISSTSFDMSVYEIFGTLAAGAAVVIPERSKHKDPRHWVELIEKFNISVWNSAPAILSLLIESIKIVDKYKIQSIRLIILGGDWAPIPLLKNIKEEVIPNSEIVVLGGATEASIHSIIYPVKSIQDHWKSIPYGHPMKNQTAYILSKTLQPLPMGMQGELYIGGIGLAKEYINNSSLTAEKFIPNPFSNITGERLYRTGDLARWMPDGNIELIGRIDTSQVKIHGLRIELEEIANVIKKIPGVLDSLVITLNNENTSKSLAAFIIMAPKVETTVTQIKSHISDYLPTFMVPSHIVFIEKIPLSPNGKVDRRQLQEYCYSKIELRQDITLPITQTEKMLTAIWKEILDVETISIDDDFFEIGGNSLKLIRVIQKLPININVIDLMRNPTISQLATKIDNYNSYQKDEKLIYQFSTNANHVEEKKTIVCVPYGGGSAVIYQYLAKLIEHKFNVYAVAIPDTQNNNKSIESIAEQCTNELKTVFGETISLYLYGHCAGVALALEIAKKLEKNGFKVERTFVGAALPWARNKLLKAIGNIQLVNPFRNQQAILNYIQKLGGIEEIEDPTKLSFVTEAFVRDANLAEDYIYNHLKSKEKLKSPITCIIGGNDPLTPNYMKKYKEWSAFSDQVDLVVIENAGHYFLKDKVTELSRILIESTSNISSATNGE